MLPPGQSARVTRVLAAGPGMQRKLSAMGILPGSVVAVLNAQNGPLLIRVGDSRVGLGRGMAQRIMVASHQQ
jgi:ferrous iron transport protein A